MVKEPGTSFLTGIPLSKTGFTEVIVVWCFGGAVIFSWLAGVLLWIFPRHESEYYRRRLVANMPRARDEILPSELQLQSTIQSLTHTAGSVPQNKTSDQGSSAMNPPDAGVDGDSPTMATAEVFDPASMTATTPGQEGEMPSQQSLPPQPVKPEKEKQVKQQKEKLAEPAPAVVEAVPMKPSPPPKKKDKGKKKTKEDKEKEKEEKKKAKEEKEREKEEKKRAKEEKKKAAKEEKKKKEKEEKPKEDKKKDKKEKPPKEDKKKDAKKKDTPEKKDKK